MEYHPNSLGRVQLDEVMSGPAPCLVEGRVAVVRLRISGSETHGSCGDDLSLTVRDPRLFLEAKPRDKPVQRPGK